MSKAKAYKTMVRMFERRSQRLDEAMAQERRMLGELEQAKQQCDAAWLESQAAQSRAGSERDEIMTRAFTPEALLVMNLRVEAKVAQTAQAVRAVQQAEQKVQTQNTVLAQAQREQRRNGQRIELFDNARKAVVKAAEAMQEENDEEEAAEGFVARMLAKRRAARAP